MRDTTTFIKLDRNILDWGWYTDANTFRVFVHLLLKANIKEHYFKGTLIERGSVATSYESIAKSLKLTIRQTRTAIDHLKMTHEVTTKNCGSFLLVSILSYDRYQANRQMTRHTDDTKTTDDSSVRRQQSKNIKNKEDGRFPNGETAEERKKRLEELRNQ